MRPAFDSPRQAAAFAWLLLLLLAAPWLAGKNFLPPREQAYATEGWTWGPYPWIQKQIFEETNDIDIAFVGSSHMMWGIDTPWVQEKLDERMGHKTVVRSICWGGSGFDSLYIITRDLLKHRRVKTLVFYGENLDALPNPESPHWFRFGDDARELSGLPFRDQAVFYFAAINGLPENLLELLTPNLPEATNVTRVNYFEKNYHAANPETTLGSVSGQIGFLRASGLPDAFTPYIPPTGATPADALTYSSQTRSHFLFLNRAGSPLQSHFARKFSLLAQSNGCQLVLLHLPVFDESRSAEITEAQYWPDFLHTSVAMIGIPAGRLFAGLSEPDREKLFWERGHLNQNGQNYFTPLITPALLQAYENRPNH